MINPLKKSPQIERIYNFLVQIDYLTGLCTAYMLGEKNWFMFFSLLALSLVLGCITVATYIKVMKNITNG